MLRSASTRFFKHARNFSTATGFIARQLFTGNKSNGFGDLLLHALREKNIKITHFPRKKINFSSGELGMYEALLKNPNDIGDVDDKKIRIVRIERAIQAILPSEELIPLQGEEDVEGNVKSYDEQKISQLILCGFLLHCTKNENNSFLNINNTKILEPRNSNNGFGAFAYPLSGLYMDIANWFDRILESKLHIFVFVPRNLDLRPFTIEKQKLGEICSVENIDMHLVMTTEPTSDGSKKIIIHDYTLAALLFARFVENFQIGEKIIGAIFAEYKDLLGEPIQGDLYANVKHILKALNPDKETNVFNEFKEKMESLLRVHRDLCQFIDDNPKLSEKLKELNLLTAVKEIPGKIIKLDLAQGITNAADQKGHSSTSFKIR